VPGTPGAAVAAHAAGGRRLVDRSALVELPEEQKRDGDESDIEEVPLKEWPAGTRFRLPLGDEAAAGGDDGWRHECEHAERAPPAANRKADGKRVTSRSSASVTPSKIG
jgi:hypothetical protein